MTKPYPDEVQAHIKLNHSTLCLSFSCVCGMDGHFDIPAGKLGIRCPGCKRVWEIGTKLPMYDRGTGGLIFQNRPDLIVDAAPGTFECSVGNAYRTAGRP